MLELLDATSLAAMLPAAAHPHQAIFVSMTADAPHFRAAAIDDNAHPRVLQSVKYLSNLYAIAKTSGSPMRRDSFVVQTDDCPHETPSYAFERHPHWTDVTLLPDLYYFKSQGYMGFNPQAGDWWSRTDRLVWRGWSTGILGLTMESLMRLPRFRLVNVARSLGEVVDAGLVGVAQAASPDDESTIRTYLEREGLIKDFIPMEQMTTSRYLLDIDGNANSWALVARLRLGACMLKVASPWMQWLYPRLTPWHHFVPVNADLSDFADRLQWCRDNPDVAAAIAREGRRFSLGIHFDEEMAQAAKRVFAEGNLAAS